MYKRQEEPELLSNIVRIFKDIPENCTVDIFGEIYEYFLGNFALAEGKDCLLYTSRHAADRGCRYSFSYSGATPSTIATQRKKLKYPVTRGKCR